nr:initiation-specific alpha-1,6-mannosyltransferase [Quercus suber]
MISYKRALVLAVFVLTCVLVLSNTRSSSSGSFSPSGHWFGYVGEAEVQQLVDESHVMLAEKLSSFFPYDREPDFPTHIWQTWKSSPSDKGFGSVLFRAQASWADLNPKFEHEVVKDSAAMSLIRDLYAEIPEIYQAYNALPEPVLKADFFRYLVLLARGGIYSDIDTTALKPASRWVPSEFARNTYGLVVGIEADSDRPDWQDWYARRIQFCQWTMQSKPGHPVLVDIVASIAAETMNRKALGKLDKKHMKSVMEFTGPGIWTDAVFNHFNSPSMNANVTWETFANLTQPMKMADDPGKETKSENVRIDHDIPLRVQTLRYSQSIKRRQMAPCTTPNSVQSIRGFSKLRSRSLVIAPLLLYWFGESRFRLLRGGIASWQRILRYCDHDMKHKIAPSASGYHEPRILKPSNKKRTHCRPNDAIRNTSGISKQPKILAF